MASAPPTPLPRTPTTASAGSDALARIEQQLARLEERSAWIDDARGSAAALELVERLTRPETLRRLTRVLDVADSLPKFAATIADTFDAYANDAEAAGVELDSFAPRLGRLSTQIATALQAADRAQAVPVGIFALLRELRDPHVRETLGFALAFARAFGDTTQRQRALTSANR